MILMSNNQWYCEKNCPAWEAAGEDCSPAGRVGGLVRAYREIGPDILGLQEVSPGMAVRMMERLAEEARRDGDGAVYEYISGGDTPLVYRRDRFKLLESGFFRYEEQVPGLQGSFNNNETKSYAFGVFERRSDAARRAETMPRSSPPNPPRTRSRRCSTPRSSGPRRSRSTDRT